MMSGNIYEYPFFLGKKINEMKLIHIKNNVYIHSFQRIFLLQRRSLYEENNGFTECVILYYCR